MGFDDLLEFNGTDIGTIVGYTYDLKVGTTWQLTWTVVDGDDANVDLSTGFTASANLCTNDGVSRLAFTHEETSGREIDLSEPGSIVLRSTPAGNAGMSSYYLQPLRFDLTVTRTSDGAKVPMIRDCFIVPRRLDAA